MEPGKNDPPVVESDSYGLVVRAAEIFRVPGEQNLFKQLA
jgi:hypothetical protein